MNIKLRDFSTVILSDIHFGSNLCQSHRLQSVLSQLLEPESNIARVILNGDIIDSAKILFPQSHWSCIELLNQLHNRGDVELMWVMGNHEEIAHDKLEYLFKIPTTPTCYTWKEAKTRFAATHGDKWDKRFSENNWSQMLNNILYRIYKMVSKFDLDLARNLPNSHEIIRSRMVNNSEKVISESMDYAHRYNISVIGTGHTHVPCIKTKLFDGKFVISFNTGSWTGSTPTLVGIADTTLYLCEVMENGELTILDSINF